MATIFNALDSLRLIVAIMATILFIFWWYEKDKYFKDYIILYILAMYFGYLVPTEDINSVLPQLPQFTEEDNVEPSFFDALKYNIGFFSFLKLLGKI